MVIMGVCLSSSVVMLLRTYKPLLKQSLVIVQGVIVSNRLVSLI